MAVLAAGAVVLLGAVAVAAGEVSQSEDNPPGCTTATAEDQEQCGAQGRDHFAQPDHRPPIEACADDTAASGSRLTRILPDGPRHDDGSLAFVSGACVYLPPGFDPGLRYPVVYVLHGGGGDQADWVSFGDIRGVLDRAHAEDPSRAVIAVMPDGRSGQWYDYEDGEFLIETYVLDHLIPWVDAEYPTIRDRRGRAIVGLSNGGYGAIHLAGKRPDLFVAAGGMSSNLGARTLSGLGESGAVHHQGSVPYQLAENYDEVDLVLDVAATCTSPDPLCATIVVDLLFVPDHVAFDQRTDEVEHRGEIDIRYADGAHQFTWWTPWLEERQLPFLQQRLSPPVRPGREPRSRTPERFRYRSISPEFSAWGTDVTVDRDVREFLDLRDVSATGFEIQGSGTATVTTARYFRPGERISVTGADGTDTPRTLTADGEGRLRVEVDLGPSHEHDQFTAEADLQAQTAGEDHFTVRAVRFETAPPSGSATGDPAPTAAASSSDPAHGSDPTPALDPRPLSTTQPTGERASTDERAEASVEPGAASPQLAGAPISTRGRRGPQPVPTALFVALLAGGAALAWRRHTSKEDA